MGTATTATLARALILAASLALTAGSAFADGAWLDEPLASWNVPGSAIPGAPARTGATDPRCERLHRPAETAEDEAIVAAGWTLFGSYQSGWGLRLVYGLVEQDGMCRPVEYQEFVFVDGVFAGTISPIPMNARTDAAESATSISAPGESIRAQFVRYKDSDPLCCPSRVTSVEFQINRDSGVPVLVPGAVFTTPGAT